MSQTIRICIAVVAPLAIACGPSVEESAILTQGLLSAAQKAYGASLERAAEFAGKGDLAEGRRTLQQRAADLATNQIPRIECDQRLRSSDREIVVHTMTTEKQMLEKAVGTNDAEFLKFIEQELVGLMQSSVAGTKK